MEARLKAPLVEKGKPQAQHVADTHATVLYVTHEGMHDRYYTDLPTPLILITRIIQTS